ncbi:MAG: helix-turn-helix transcriptional regulator [Chitinophagaceae bacterium]|nr:helix-turn-helix transcriptional regulator [Chitinophagaceae bacterium]
MKKSIGCYHEQIGLNIQAYRKHHQLSLQDLSRQCGIEVSQLQRIERGEVNFRLTTLIRLMYVIGQNLFFPLKKAK